MQKLKELFEAVTILLTPLTRQQTPKSITVGEALGDKSDFVDYG
jgi:hypothetical protein